MIASDILDRVSMQLNDQGRVRWTLPMLLNYLTDAMRQTVLVRPDANARAHVVKLTPGSTRQRIPEGSLMFLAMVRNMGPDGLTPGRPIEPTTREAMNTLASGWHLEFGSEEIDQYAFVQATPDCFWVTPPPGESVFVEIECADDIPQVRALTDALPLSGIWAEPLREYVLYRAYSLNATSAADRGRATEHLQQYYVALGYEDRARVLGNPYNRSYSIPRS